MAGVDDALHAQALAVMQALLLRRAGSLNRQAFLLGVRQAELELGMRGLFDPAAQLFVQEFEFDAIRSLSGEMSLRVQSAVLEAVREGVGERRLAPVIARVTGKTLHRARQTARQETNRAANFARLASWKQSGVVKRKRCVATIDDQVRADHLAADGDEVGIDEPYTAGAAAGFQSPPFDFNCRCTHIPVTSLREKLPGAEARDADRRRRVAQQQERLGATAVTESIPGLRALEARHEASLAAAWTRWTSTYERLIRDSVFA